MTDSSEFFSRLDPPLLVATTTDGVERSGCLVGFATQSSIHPPRFLVCISVLNHTSKILASANVMAVHVLGREQGAMASLFGEETGDRSDKFAAVAWHLGRSGAPVLDECAAWIEGAVLERLALGDHTGFLLEVVAAGSGGAAGVLRQSSVPGLEAGHPAVEIARGAAR